LLIGNHCSNELLVLYSLQWSGADRGSNRVKRGGNWNNNAQNCRSANRNNNSPGNRNNNLGLRLASSRDGALRRVQGRVAGVFR